MNFSALKEVYFCYEFYVIHSKFFFFYLANDVILSHMVTFLNDKTDKHLRASFFDNFVNVVAFVDQQCSPILCPLLQQVNL